MFEPFFSKFAANIAKIMHLCILFKHFCFMQHNYNSMNDMLNISWLLISIFAMSKGKNI